MLTLSSPGHIPAMWGTESLGLSTLAYFVRHRDDCGITAAHLRDAVMEREVCQDP
jgi:hypothetical protein